MLLFSCDGAVGVNVGTAVAIQFAVLVTEAVKTVAEGEKVAGQVGIVPPVRTLMITS